RASGAGLVLVPAQPARCVLGGRGRDGAVYRDRCWNKRPYPGDEGPGTRGGATASRGRQSGPSRGATTVGGGQPQGGAGGSGPVFHPGQRKPEVEDARPGGLAAGVTQDRSGVLREVRCGTWRRSQPTSGTGAGLQPPGRRPVVTGRLG